MFTAARGLGMHRSDVSLSLPHSTEAEKAVLGAILRDAEQFHLLLSKVNLHPDHFYQELHRDLFSVMLQQDSASQPIDIISVAEGLQFLSDKDSKNSKEINPAYLVELVESSPITENIEFHANLIKKKFFLRKIINTCQETVKRAQTFDDDIRSFLDQVEGVFLSISKDQEENKGLSSVKDSLLPTLDELEKRIVSDGEVTGVSTGFNDIDKFTGGWQKSDLIILAARPGMGKTALALNWVMSSVKQNKKQISAIFSLEMSKQQLIERLLSAEGRLDSSRLRKGDLSDEDQDRLMHAARQMDDLGLRVIVDETPGLSLMELRSRCRRYQRENGLDLVLIDYLQLMTGSPQSQKQGREREISEISMGLKAMAKELQIPVIACAQLNRSPDARPDKRPRISDLRESGSMEQDADQILFIYRDEYYNANSEHAGKAEIIIAKNRHGETGSAFLAWLPNYVSFHNLAKDT